MFVHPRPKAVAAFTPPALPGFIAIPTSIPDHPSFCFPPFHCRFAYSGPFSSTPRLDGRLARSVSYCVARCCLRPRSGRLSLVLRAIASVACVHHKSFGPLKFTTISGLTTRFSVSRFTSQPCPTPCFSACPQEQSFRCCLFRLPAGFLVAP